MKLDMNGTYILNSKKLTLFVITVSVWSSGSGLKVLIWWCNKIGDSNVLKN